MIRNFALLSIFLFSLSQAFAQHAGKLFYLDDNKRLAALDPNTAGSTAIATAPLFDGGVLPGTVAVDNEGARFFFVTSDAATGEELVTVSLDTGEPLSALSLNITPTFLEYHCRNKLLYTIDEDNRLVSVDPASGAMEAIAPIPAPLVVVSTASLDPYTDRLFFVSDEGSSLRLFSISTENGDVLASLDIGDDVSYQNLEYNCRDGQLYGLFNSQNFGRIDPESGIPVTLSGPVAPSGFLPFSQSLSLSGQAYTFSGQDENGQARLYTLSLADGAVLSEPLIGNEYFLYSYMAYANRCSAEADFGLALGCAGDTTRFTNTSTLGASFLWNFGDPSSGAANTSMETNPRHVYKNPGVYTVTLIAVDCGADTLSKEIEVTGLSVSPFADTTLACEDDFPLTLNARTDGATYLWQDGSMDSTFVVEAGDVPLDVTVQVFLGACDAEFSTFVDRDEDANCPCLLAMPNVFTPNGDGHNDFFQPAERNCRIKAGSYALRIYNRWGEMVYEGADPDAPGWDGTYKGNLMPSEVYFYTLQYIAETDLGDMPEERKGDLSLLR